MSSPETSSPYNKDNLYSARLTENRVLSGPGSAKDTRHFVVDLGDSGLTYEAGDSLGVQATNRPEDVDAILQRLGATGEERVSPAILKLAEPIPLREALLARLSLATPTAKVLGLIRDKATDPAEKARLEELLKPEAKEALSAYLKDREFPDLLQEFPSARIAPQELVDLMRKLVPRLYSIASSPKLFPKEIHLTVAIVRYQTNGRDRVGVCSSFMADRVQVGVTPVPVFVSNSHFKPPEDGSRDVIMVGPGTGIAPFRAFVQERTALGAQGRNWVFFGDQHRASDYLYGEEWESALDRGEIARLDLAWSRDQAHKIYVQDRMREQAAELWSWISGGAGFYVCGDAKRMAKDVDAALHEIIAQQGGMTPEAAADYVKAMKKEKRYQRDVY